MRPAVRRSITESASTSGTSCTAISGRAAGSTSPSLALRSTWLRVSRPSPNNWGEPCCCPARSPTSSRAISISNASANIRCAASTTRSSCSRITAECRSAAGFRPQGARISTKGHHQRESVSAVAGKVTTIRNVLAVNISRAALSLVRHHNFPFSASAFDVGQSLGNLRKWIRSVDCGLQFSLLDEFGKQREVAAAWMHEEIAIADASAAGPGSDTIANEPEHHGKNSAAVQIPDRGLRFWKRSHRNDPGSRLHDFEHLLQGLAADQVESRI